MNYEAIEQHIRAARLQRTVYLAELIADALVSLGRGITLAAEVVFTKARTTTYKLERNIFTFDA